MGIQNEVSKIDLQNSMKILHFLRNISESKDCLCEFPLQSEDIIVINNEKFFHGRNRFTTKVKRSLYRIQILN